MQERRDGCAMTPLCLVAERRPWSAASWIPHPVREDGVVSSRLLLFVIPAVLFRHPRRRAGIQ